MASRKRAGTAPTARVVAEHVVQRECAGCGTVFTPNERGRPGRYCRPACRQRAWALRQAETTLTEHTDPRPAVVREVLERVIEPAPIRPSPPAIPTHARGWVTLLEELGDQLDTDTSRIVREHWHHRRLADTLLAVLEALEDAHPGQLLNRR